MLQVLPDLSRRFVAGRWATFTRHSFWRACPGLVGIRSMNEPIVQVFTPPRPGTCRCVFCIPTLSVGMINSSSGPRGGVERTQLSNDILRPFPALTNERAPAPTFCVGVVAAIVTRPWTPALHRTTRTPFLADLVVEYPSKWIDPMTLQRPPTNGGRTGVLN